MYKIFSFCNQKGGVGKTTTALNLAAGLSAKKKKVLLIDLDPQGNATSGVGVEKNIESGTAYEVILRKKRLSEVIVETSFTNLDLVASNSSLAGAEIELASVIGREFILKEACDEIRSKYDFIFLDCPPSLGLLTLNGLVASDGLMIPLQCEYYALEGLGQLMGTFQLVKERLNQKLEIGGIVLTMADFRTNLTQQVIDDVRKHFEDKVFKVVIPRSVKISEAPSFGKPVIFYDPHCRGAISYAEAADEFANRFPEAKDVVKIAEGTEQRVVVEGKSSEGDAEKTESPAVVGNRPT
jgi:chromosome partitioning protein